MTFDFSAIKATATKPADIPAITRPRNLAANPLAEHFAKSHSKLNAEGEGPWFTLANLPIVDAADGIPFGTVVKTALTKLQQAAGNVNSGIEKRANLNDDNTVTVYFRAVPKRIVNRKPKTDENTAAE